MTDQTADLPAVGSQWESPDGSNATVTGVRLIGGDPYVSYTAEIPGPDKWETGLAAAGFFTATRTQVNNCARCNDTGDCPGCSSGNVPHGACTICYGDSCCPFCPPAPTDAPAAVRG